jgi:hypothetical protein
MERATDYCAAALPLTAAPETDVAKIRRYRQARGELQPTLQTRTSAGGASTVRPMMPLQIGAAHGYRFIWKLSSQALTLGSSCS